MRSRTTENHAQDKTQKRQDGKMEAKIQNAINFIGLKSKKKVTSQRIFSFINKGALQLDCQKFNDIVCDMEIDGKIYKNGSCNNASFFSKTFFLSKAISLDKNSDLTVNNTHIQSSVSYHPNKSIAIPDTLQNLENFIDCNSDRIRSATLTIHHINTNTSD